MSVSGGARHSAKPSFVLSDDVVNTVCQSIFIESKSRVATGKGLSEPFSSNSFSPYPRSSTASHEHSARPNVVNTSGPERVGLYDARSRTEGSRHAIPSDVFPSFYMSVPRRGSQDASSMSSMSCPFSHSSCEVADMTTCDPQRLGLLDARSVLVGTGLDYCEASNEARDCNDGKPQCESGCKFSKHPRC